MTPNDPRAACDRLAQLFERAEALEQKGRRSTDDTVPSPLTPFVVAQLRMRVGPALADGWPVPDPVHVVLCGGTNTGKSTVLNVLLGRAAAGMGVRARLSQHPEAYRPARFGDSFLEAVPGRFTRYRRLRDEHPPRQSDEELRRDGYRPALAVLDPERLPAPSLATAVAGAVLWDAPDFSTEEAQIYLGTVIDLLALADLVVMTVTDESYADDRGHVLLRLIGESGTALIVVANKLPENPVLLDDLSRALAASGRVKAPILWLPQVRGGSPEERLASLLETEQAKALRAAVEREAARGDRIKRQGVEGALALVARDWDDLVRPLAAEAELGARWSEAVDRLTREDVLEPYRREYLEGVQYEEFNRALVQLSGLLQVPGIGPVMELAGKLVRLPFRLAVRVFARWQGPRTGRAAPPPERQVLDESVSRWLAALKAEAMSLEATRAHPAWGEMVRTLSDDDYRRVLLKQFDAAYAAYRAELDALVRGRAEAIYRELQQHPKRLNVLRGANLLGNAFSVGLVIKSAGLNWSDAVLGPVAAGLWQNLLEWGLGRFLESQRSGLKAQQSQALGRSWKRTWPVPPAHSFAGRRAPRSWTRPGATSPLSPRPWPGRAEPEGAGNDRKLVPEEGGRRPRRLLARVEEPRSIVLSDDDRALLLGAAERVRGQLLGPTEPVLTVALAGGRASARARSSTPWRGRSSPTPGPPGRPPAS